MPFDIPNLPTLLGRAEADFEALAADSLRRSDAKVIARVHGGAAYGLYGFLGHIARQILPDSCDEDVLRRWAAMRDVDRWAAVAASGSILVSGVPGAIVGKDRLWQRFDGQQYAVVADTMIADGPTLVPVRAMMPGAAGNTDPGVRLSLVSPVAGVLEQAEVDPDGLVSGLDLEPLNEWRTRVIESFRVVPHGGSDEDYVMWARQVPGVTRAWTKPNYMGPGTVGVFFVRDYDANILPGPAQIAEVYAHIESVRPVTGELYVLSPTLLQVHHRIELRPDTEQLRLRVEGSLRNMYARDADLGERIYWSHFGEAVSGTVGEVDHRILEPLDDVVPGPHELPVFGGIEWA
ncbi:baseplate J/gp47 family protein [Paracandidimonas soli]|uniref:Putative phage protein gp47/JayE n=1 Tax=Paracandidimonas soli TaxID=1917182 RepID=A0A4R3UQ56_9BURK|nr:baseplate J/gp47 family protein [Paracandidimonas soli]TCU93955.1 putative phage protein gp47/JayE [Paracandidimonas soli]